VGLRVGVDVLLYLLLPPAWVAAGLMGGNAISFVLAALLGYALMRSRIGRLGLARVAAAMTRLGVAALIAAVPAAVAVFAVSTGWGDGKLGSAVQLAVGAVVLVGAYLIAASLLRVHEVRELLSMVRSRARG
jgi:putative peptidoglycan lipid II flippase